MSLWGYKPIPNAKTLALDLEVLRRIEPVGALNRVRTEGLFPSEILVREPGISAAAFSSLVRSGHFRISLEMEIKPGHSSGKLSHSNMADTRVQPGAKSFCHTF